jgi:hypothetical protein
MGDIASLMSDGCCTCAQVKRHKLYGKEINTSDNGEKRSDL